MPWYAIAGIAVAVIAVTYFLLRVLVFQEEGSLTVRTTPPGAKIYLDNGLVEGISVERLPVSAGSHRVTVMWGQSRLDTVVTLEGKKLMTLLLTQRRPAEPVRQPETAQESAPPRESPLAAKEEHTESIRPTPAVRETGTLLLEAVPEGEVRVDDGRFQNAGNGTRINVPVGQRRIVFKGANGSLKETSMHVRAGETREIKCQFQGDVNIASTMEGKSWWASITIDGRDQGITPKTVTLPVGRHRISVRREGLDAIGGEQTITIEPAMGEKPPGYRVSFRLKKK
jgi:hypothetical protein